MTGDFLDTLSAEEKQDVMQKIEALTDLLENWAPRYSLLRTTRIPMAALCTALAFAAVVPPMSPTDCLPVAKIGMWTFGVDDTTDEQLVSLAEFQRRVEEWCSIAGDGSSNTMGEDDELTAILLEVRDELSGCPLFEPLHEYWSFGVRIFLEGMAQEYQYGLDYRAGKTHALPSLEEYLHYTLGSIGAFIWSFTVFIILGDPSIKGSLESINKALLYASAAIRLYNDLQSLDKEVKEGGINSVVITYHTMLNRNPNATEGSFSAEAKRYILQLANFCAQKCYDLIKQIRTDSGQIEKIIYRIVALQASIYSEQQDYHTAPLATTHDMSEMLSV